VKIWQWSPNFVTLIDLQWITRLEWIRRPKISRCSPHARNRLSVRSAFRTITKPSRPTSAVRVSFAAVICLSVTALAAGWAPAGWVADNASVRAVYRPSTGGWHLRKSSTSYTSSRSVSWGLSTDLPMQGDYDGDGKTDPAIDRPSTGLWAMLKSSTNYASSFGVLWGVSTDTPINKRP
jgi:hypothetical protein